MTMRFSFVATAVLFLALLVSSLGELGGLGRPRLIGQDKPAGGGVRPWTVDEAMAALMLNPRDSYLQYVAVQLARRENRLDEVLPTVEGLALGGARAQALERAQGVDLFSIFSGAAAVQESLQLDTLRGNDAPGRRRAAFPGDPEQRPAEADPAARRKARVPMTSLTGPTIKSHPWEEMLAGKKPDISPMARLTPEDFYFMEFRSVNKLLEAMEISDLWGTHLFCQATHEARTQQVGERLKDQLVMPTEPLLRPAYDLVVEAVAVTGSDLYFREGSDVTLLFRLKQPSTFKTRMDGFLAAAEKKHNDARRTTGEYRGVAYVHLATPDRAVHVFSAYPSPDLHVRSDSRVALERVLDVINGKLADGQPARSLGQTTEFAYVRSLMPRGAPEEDGFVYLSDPFVRRIVGPQLKLTERRRMLCYNHLRMLGHGALLYRTEQGKAPASLAELAKSACTPGLFGAGSLVCPDGGKYQLAPDGMTAVCSHHGHAHCLNPCCEIPLKEVTGAEADEYKAFLDEYNQYWRTFFDPIALRIQVTPQRYRIETLVLPLIDNSLYTGLAAALGGKPEALDALPVPARNIFSVAARFDKAAALRQIGAEELIAKDVDNKPKEEPAQPAALVDATRSAGNLRAIGIAMHNYHNDYLRLPLHARYGQGGKPFLSWRVELLPYLEQHALYVQFKHDEPWDSEHNKKLLDKMPAIYQRPGTKPGGFKTPYLVPIGAETVFHEKKEITLGQLTVQDGTANTIFLVEADDDQSVPWTQPDDWPFDPKKPRQGLGKNYAEGFIVCFADVSVRFVKNTIPDPTLAGCFTRNGGENETVEPRHEIALNLPGVERGGPNFGFFPAAEMERLKFGEFLAKGIGNQIGLHVYDAVPTFDFSLPSALAMALGNFDGRGGGGGNFELGIAFLIAALNAPVYVSAPVKDAKVVDEFLARLDESLAVLARKRDLLGGMLSIDSDFYQLPLGRDRNVRSYGIRFGPVKWRLFWARIGQGLYVASKPFILEDLYALEAGRTGPAAADQGPVAHALVRIRPQNWNQVLNDFRLGWAENNRCACLNNLGPLANLARAFPPAAKETTQAEREALFHRLPARTFGTHFFCPDEGQYGVSPDGKEVTCSVHGSVLRPRQQAAPGPNSRLDKLLGEFKDMTVAMTFLEDGLRAVVTIERKP